MLCQWSGMIATGVAGPLRLRFGAPRDLLLGITMVRADGTIARAGGKVVKNVAGFDLPKLAVGSLGTLFGIVEATLRVYPIPAAREGVAYALPSADALAAAARAFVAQRLEPETFAVYDGRTLTVDFAGTPSGVAAQTAAADALLRALGATPTAPPATTLEGRAWRARLTAPPAATPAGEIAYPLLGIALRASDASLDVAALRRGANAVVHALPLASRAEVDVWGPLPPSFPLMRAMKTNFDPHGLCNPGRFIGGL